MEFSTVLETLVVGKAELTRAPRTPYEALQQVRDYRAKRGRRYEAALVLTIMLLAKAAGERTVSGIAHWARLRATWLQEALGLPSLRLPCANTYHYICDHIDLVDLTRCLQDCFAKDVLQDEVQLALDGKSLRGTQRNMPVPHAAVQVVGVYDVTHQRVRHQLQVPSKGQERLTAQTLLEDLSLQGAVVSADAWHTHADWCRHVRKQGGNYLLFAKANQPILQEEIALLFSQPSRPWLPEQQAHTVNKGHGRLEMRHLRVSTELNAYLAPLWPDVAQVFQVQRQRTCGGHTTTETVYGLTSLKAPPMRLLHMIRAHWQIENRVHWRRDVTLGEDACLVSSGQVPLVLALLNNLLLALMDYLNVPNMAAQIREFAAHPEAALALLVPPL